MASGAYGASSGAPSAASTTSARKPAAAVGPTGRLVRGRRGGGNCGAGPGRRAEGGHTVLLAASDPRVEQRVHEVDERW